MWVLTKKWWIISVLSLIDPRRPKQIMFCEEEKS